jgi:hypothetical protein
LYPSEELAAERHYVMYGLVKKITSPLAAAATADEDSSLEE